MRPHLYWLGMLLCMVGHAHALQNPSFEEEPDLAGWTPFVSRQDREPRLQIVSGIARAGNRSLLLAAQDPADVGIAQILRLDPGIVWRAKAWVKTKELAASGRADALGTMQVWLDDKQLLAGAPSSPGTADWSMREVVFRSPPSGQVTLMLVLARGGKATGQAWFDDLSIERVAETSVTNGLPPSQQREHVLDFPISMNKGKPYNKFMPKNRYGRHEVWSCGQVAHAMIVRYWATRRTLRVQGSYFYRRTQDGLRIHADFNVPIPWSRMAPSLSGLKYEDPRVDPVARFAFLYGAGARAHWPWDPAVDPWDRGRAVRDTLSRYFGLDLSDYSRMPIREYLATHTWADLYARINHDLDRQMPCELVVCGPGAVHEVVITGYRQVGDHYEYMIHFSGNGYDPKRSFRIDRPIDHWTSVPEWLITWGIKPYDAPDRAPLYNKLADFPGTMDWSGRPAMAWNGQEYGALVPSGPSGQREYFFQRVAANGLPAGKPFPLPSHGNVRVPSLIWDGRQYAVAWADGAPNAGGIYFAQLGTEGKPLAAPDAPVRPGADLPSLACSGDGYGLVFLYKNDVTFVRLSRSGAMIADSAIVLGRLHAPYITWAGGAYAVSWADRQTIFLSRIGPRGERLGDSRLAIPDAVDNDHVRVALGGDSYGLAWMKDMGQYRQMCFCLADPQGRILPNTQIVVSDKPGAADCPNLSFAAGVYVLTYRHGGQTYVSRISASGKLLETRALYHRSDALCHAIGGGSINLLFICSWPREKILDAETCLLSLANKKEAATQIAGASH